jgi:mRNA interferase HigB
LLIHKHTMIIFSSNTIREFNELHPDAADALNNWRRIVSKTSFSNFAQVRSFFNSVDAVGNDLYVFNIRGNRYRLIALMHFNVRTVYIRFIGTHKQYDKLDVKSL